MHRYSGVTIKQDGLGEEAEKAKGLAELDSLTVNYGGRTHVL